MDTAKSNTSWRGFGKRKADLSRVTAAGRVPGEVAGPIVTNRIGDIWVLAYVVLPGTFDSGAGRLLGILRLVAASETARASHQNEVSESVAVKAPSSVPAAVPLTKPELHRQFACGKP